MLHPAHTYYQVFLDGEEPYGGVPIRNVVFLLENDERMTHDELGTSCSSDAYDVLLTYVPTLALSLRTLSLAPLASSST